MDDLDEPTRKILLIAKIDPESGSRLVCVGVVGGDACRDHLYQCRHCKQIGCRTTACSQHLFDDGNVCQRCGVSAGMNRNVKLSAVRLGEAWKRLHGGKDAG